jgi:hypothetical protein
VYNQLLGIKLRILSLCWAWCISIQNHFGSATDHTRGRWKQALKNDSKTRYIKDKT